MAVSAHCRHPLINSSMKNLADSEALDDGAGDISSFLSRCFSKEKHSRCAASHALTIGYRKFPPNVGNLAGSIEIWLLKPPTGTDTDAQVLSRQLCGLSVNISH